MDNIKKIAAKYKPYLIILAVVLLLEVFLFNGRTFSLIGGGYQNMQLPLYSAQINGGELSGKGVSATGGTMSIEFNNINQKIRTLYVELSDMDKKTITKKIDIAYKDATYSEEYRSAWTTSDFKIINNNKRSFYTTLNVSGEVKDLRLKIPVDNNEKLAVKSVEINPTIPFKFSFIRVLSIFAFISCIYILWSSRSLKKAFKDNTKLCQNVFSIVTALVIIIMCFFTYIAHTANDFSMIEGIGLKNGNQISKELVDAFEAGQVSLLKTPSDKMMSLENPYDYSQRIAANVNSEAWDHCLYNGKYYSYYGIGPVLTLFLPYHKLTGYYFSTEWAVLIYSIIGIIFLSKLYRAFVSKFFAKTRSSLVVMGHFMIMVSSGIFFSVVRPMFYEIAISSAFAAVAIGAYLLITANVIGEGEINHKRLAASTAFLGFAVLCRPTTAVYCVASLAFIYFGFRKVCKADNYYKNKKWNNKLKYLACALIPYAFFGGLQMWYNYARFDSPLDFGINYSLTINDFTASEFHIHFAVISFFAFLFAVPQIIPNFPYISGEFNKLNLTGFYFADDISTKGLAIGAIFRALPIFSYLFGFKALKKLEKKARIIPTVLIVLTCLIAPAAIIFSSWESGFAVRYYADFSWQLLIGALAIAFFLFEKCDNEGVKRIVEGVFIVMTALCLIVNAGQIYNFIVAAAGLNNYTSAEWECKILAFARLFDFWI
ncbi:MAG: hypothetical protein IJM37_00295 [Lachnospiraceae bacterium]|nr:hypothetical protein [Lachnospiraceae bacterium]